MPTTMKVDVKLIRRLLASGCRAAFRIPVRVPSYSSVLEGWRAYLGGSLELESPEAHLVEGVFEYHRDHDDHVILYHSGGMSDCLLLCKTGGRYAHISVPCDEPRRACGFVGVYY